MTSPMIQLPTGPSVTPKDVLPRDGLIPRAADRLLDGGDWFLTGSDRLGKTSIARAVLHLARTQGAYTIHLDLAGMISQEQLAARLVQGAVECRTGLWPQRLPDWGALSDWLRSPHVAAQSMDITGHHFPDMVPPGEAWTIALAVAEAVAAHDSRPLVIVVDAWDSALLWNRTFGGPGALRRWAAIRPNQSHTSYAWIGTRADQLIPYLVRDSHRPASLVDHLFVESLSWTDWIGYLRQHLARSGWTIAAQALVRLHSATAGHPGSVVTLTQAAVTGAQLAGRTVVTDADVRQAVPHAVNAASGHYVQYWTDACQAQGARALLTTLADGCRPRRSAYPRSAWRHLATRGHLSAHGGLVDPLFGSWIRHLRVASDAT